MARRQKVVNGRGFEASYRELASLRATRIFDDSESEFALIIKLAVSACYLVTAGGVVFMGTPCTATGANNAGGCAASVPPGGALWAVDATSGAVLGNSVGAPPVPILHTPDQIRMAPTVDGQWVYVLDKSGNIYALTTDPTVPAAAIKAGRRIAPSLKIRHR